MKVGARTFKTGIAVGLAIFIAQLFHMDMFAFAGMAAFFAIQPSLFRSFTHFTEQIQANLLGALFAVVALVSVGNEPLVIGIVVTLLIALNYRLGFENIGISVLTAIAILSIHDTNILYFSLERFGGILIGIFSALLVNVVFLPPKYEDRLLHHLIETSEHLSIFLRSVIYGELEKKFYSEAKDTIEANMTQATEFYNLYKDEFTSRMKKAKYHESKKLIVYKHMIELIRKEQLAFYTLEEHSHHINQLDDDLKYLLQNHLLRLTSVDEKIFLKYEQKSKVKQPRRIYEQIQKDTETIVSRLIALYHKNPDVHQSMITISAILVQLTDELERLNRLVDIYSKERESD